jgi:hypothetical protein
MPDRSTGELARSPRPEGRAVMGNGTGCAATLLEAGMNGDLVAWQEGLAQACDAELNEDERRRFELVGGPAPVALENVLRGLGTPARPPGHVGRLRLLAERYRLALDGDRDLLRWVEAALGHPYGSLGRCGLLGPHGFPLHVQDLGAGLEPGELPAGWLGRVDPAELAGVCRLPEQPLPVWVLLSDVGEELPQF